MGEAVASMSAIPANVEPFAVVQVTVGTPTARTAGELIATVLPIVNSSAIRNLQACWNGLNFTGYTSRQRGGLNSPDERHFIRGLKRSGKDHNVLNALSIGITPSLNY